MLATDLVTREVERVSPTDTVQTAARKMRDANVGFLPVCDVRGKVVGALTDRDIVIRIVAEELPTTEHVAQVMTLEW